MKLVKELLIELKNELKDEILDVIKYFKILYFTPVH